jgi:8-oxo-dGTP pyrophosphatase MutT (NUDIX family)
VLLVLHEERGSGRSWWVLPGGGREPGETLAEAAVRAVRATDGL